MYMDFLMPVSVQSVAAPRTLEFPEILARCETRSHCEILPVGKA
jgi:hypothetical protein